MTSRRVFTGSILAIAAIPLLSSAQTCCSAGAKDTKCCASKLKATGAVVLESNEKKTKIKVKCTKCGFLSAEIEIDTPTADKPYTLDWTCPKCGNKQKVTVEVPAA